MIKNISDVKEFREIIECKFRDAVRDLNKKEQDIFSEDFYEAMRLFCLVVMVASDDEIGNIIMIAQVMNRPADTCRFVDYIRHLDDLHFEKNTLRLQNAGVIK